MLISELKISFPRKKGLNKVIRRLSTFRTWMLTLAFNILTWIQRDIWGKIAQTRIWKPFRIISVFIHSRDLGSACFGLRFRVLRFRNYPGLLLRCFRWSSGHRSFGIKPSTARISSHLSNRALLCLQRAVISICLRNTLRFTNVQ